MTEDLPTLDRPAKAIWGSPSRGQAPREAAERTNSTLCKFIGFSYWRMPVLRSIPCSRATASWAS